MTHGKSLRDCDSRTLFEIAYASWMEIYLAGEEGAKGREGFERLFSDRIREDEDGIPAAVRAFASADATKYVAKDN